MFLSAQDRAKAKALKSPVYLAALELLDQSQKNAIAAHNVVEVIAAGVCAFHQADGKYQIEAESKNLAEIVTKYTNPPPPPVARSTVSSRLRAGVRAIGTTLAGGAVAGLVLFGLVYVTTPPAMSAAVTWEDFREFQAEKWAGPTLAADLAEALNRECADCSPLPLLPIWRGHRPRPQLSPWEVSQPSPLLLLANRERSTR